MTRVRVRERKTLLTGMSFGESGGVDAAGIISDNNNDRQLRHSLTTISSPLSHRLSAGTGNVNMGTGREEKGNRQIRNTVMRKREKKESISGNGEKAYLLFPCVRNSVTDAGTGV